jgi:sugar porter (SP) family MFS transporter
MLNNIRILPQWTDYFNDPQGSRLGLLTALYSIGSIASLPVVPFISDRFGRKMAIIIGCIIMIVAGSVQASAQSLSAFEGGRFFMGFGNSMAQLSSPLLLTELCHPQHRGKVTAIYNCLWNLGAIINTWLTFGTKRIDSTWSWRIPTLGQAFPSVIQILFIWFIPESPRWLISKDRTDEALQVLGKYHANGNINHPTVQFEFAEIRETLRLEFLYKKSSSYLDFAKTKGNRYRFLLIMSLGLFSQWSGNGLVSYFSNELYDSVGITSSDTKLILNGSQTILSLLVSVGFAFLADKVGRRPLFLIATSGMMLAFLAWTVCAAQFQEHGLKAAGNAVVAFIWIHGVFYAFAWSGLLVAYTVEILPFKIRAKGLMIMNFWVQVALVVNQYLNPIALNKLNPDYKFYIIYTVSQALTVIRIMLTNFSAGLHSNSSSSTSSMLRLVVLLWKKSQESSTVTRLKSGTLTRRRLLSWALEEV